ncbi:unnamed protein product, partial [Symbiodinium sp. CCMP2456]
RPIPVLCGVGPRHLEVFQIPGPGPQSDNGECDPLAARRLPGESRQDGEAVSKAAVAG